MLRSANLFATVIVALVLSALFLPAPAQTVAGSTLGALVAFNGDDVSPMATSLTEVEYQFPWGGTEFEEAKQWGGLVSFFGGATDGTAGSMIPGLGYRHYVRAGGGNVYPGFGVALFILGNDTPELSKSTLFAGPEVLLEVLSGETGHITGLVGVYPPLVGDDVWTARAGLRLAGEL